MLLFMNSIKFGRKAFEASGIAIILFHCFLPWSPPSLDASVHTILIASNGNEP